MSYVSLFRPLYACVCVHCISGSAWHTPSNALVLFFFRFLLFTHNFVIVLFICTMPSLLRWLCSVCCESLLSPFPPLFSLTPIRKIGANVFKSLFVYVCQKQPVRKKKLLGIWWISEADPKQFFSRSFFHRVSCKSLLHLNSTDCCCIQRLFVKIHTDRSKTDWIESLTRRWNVRQRGGLMW